MSITRKKGPLYLQVKKIVKDRILHGIYPLGGHIPPEPQLEQEFMVSKMTVRNAIRELAEEGYVVKRSGIGTIVLSNKPISRISKGKHFTEILVEDGYRIEKRLLRISSSNQETGTELHQLFGHEVTLIERIYILNERPYIHFFHYLPAALLVAVEQKEGEPMLGSLYDLLEEQDRMPDSFRDAFSVDIASQETGQLLGLPAGSPVLKRLRIARDAEGRAVEYSIGYYHTEIQPYLLRYDS